MDGASSAGSKSCSFTPSPVTPESATPMEQVIRDMARVMMEKYDKYWSNINGILAVAAILDPRDKLECVEFYFSEIFGDKCQAAVNRVKGLLYELLNEYHDTSGKDDSTFASTSTTGTTLGKRSTSTPTSTDKWSQMKKTKKRKANVRCELDHYLEDETLPESSEFDVLNFWKTDLKYPTLRKIAKDILAIPASTVASESAFSIGGRVVSPQRSSLQANTIEALMCMQNWILGEYSENSFKNSQACATILEDVDMGDGGNVTSSTSEVVDVISDGEDMEI